MKRQVFAAVAGFSLLFGLSGCGTDDAPTQQPSSSSGSSETPQSGSEGTEGSGSGMQAAPSIDRASSPWNNDFPAEFPLEEVPMPANGTFDYAELVEEGVWNVMISDVPNADHEAWIATMNSGFKNMDEDSIYYIGKGESGTMYGVRAMIYDKTDSTVTVAYRISV